MGGFSAGIGHHAGGAHLSRNESTVMESVMADELKSRGIKPPQYYTGTELVLAIVTTAFICTIVFFIIWEVT